VATKADVAFERSKHIAGVNYCSPAQVAADLAQQTGRNLDARDALIDWMRRDQGWRTHA
jgi:hypothetical protein